MTAPARFGLVGAALLGLNLLVAVPSAHAAPPEREPHVFTCSEDTPTDAQAASSDDEVGTHPSGKEDKGLTESGNSGTQGKSDSDPDGTYNGGSDKPDCEGGYAVDGEYDRDGNNGCGNDADFEDDNNGNCGKGKKERPADDGPVVPFGAPDEDPADDPAPKSVVDEDPAPVVEPPAPVEDPDPAPVEEEEGPIVWADEDPADDPNPDDEYGDNDVPVLAEEPAATATDAPDMDLAAHRDLARTGGLLAAVGLAAAAAVFGSGRRVVAFARRRLMS